VLAFGFLSTELTTRRPALEFYNQSPRLQTTRFELGLAYFTRGGNLVHDRDMSIL